MGVPEPLHSVPGCADPHGTVCQAARRYANALGLRNHAIEVMDPLTDPPRTRNALMEVELPYGREYVRLRYRVEYVLQPLEEQKLALTHEMLHAHMQQLTERTRAVTATELGGAGFRVFWAGFNGDVEHLVDSLASVLAGYMPDIDWG